jgi:hypothetical protein
MTKSIELNSFSFVVGFSGSSEIGRRHRNAGLMLFGLILAVSAMIFL